MEQICLVNPRPAPAIVMLPIDRDPGGYASAIQSGVQLPISSGGHSERTLAAIRMWPWRAFESESRSCAPTALSASATLNERKRIEEAKGLLNWKMKKLRRGRSHTAECRQSGDAQAQKIPSKVRGTDYLHAPSWLKT